MKYGLILAAILSISCCTATRTPEEHTLNKWTVVNDSTWEIWMKHPAEDSDVYIAVQNPRIDLHRITITAICPNGKFEIHTINLAVDEIQGTEAEGSTSNCNGKSGRLSKDMASLLDALPMTSGGPETEIGLFRDSLVLLL